jgi:hypothetical protein
VEFVEGVRGIGVAGDDNISSSFFDAGLVGATVAFAWFDDDFGAFTDSDFPGFICGVAIDDEDLQLPVFVLEFLDRYGIDGFTDACFFVECGDDDADLQE